MWLAKQPTISLLAATGGATATVPARSIEWIADPWIMAICAFGVPIGIVARVAVNIDARKDWSEIKRDALVSLFLASTNFILAVGAAKWFSLPPLFALVVSIAIAASGSTALLGLIRKLQEWLERSPSQGEKLQEAQRIKSAVSLVLREQREEEAARNEAAAQGASVQSVPADQRSEPADEGSTGSSEGGDG